MNRRISREFRAKGRSTEGDTACWWSRVGPMGSHHPGVPALGGGGFGEIKQDREHIG